MKQKEYLTAKEFAEKFNVSIGWVYKYVKTGDIPVIKMPGNVIRIDSEKYLQQYGDSSTAKKHRSLKICNSSLSSQYHIKGDTSWLD